MLLTYLPKAFLPVDIVLFIPIKHVSELRRVEVVKSGRPMMFCNYGSLSGFCVQIEDMHAYVNHKRACNRRDSILVWMNKL